jgi:hypothetical protein
MSGKAMHVRNEAENLEKYWELGFMFIPLKNHDFTNLPKNKN